jgi:hypothetical protein
MLCRPLFLLLYEIIRHTIFDAIFNHEGLTYLSMSLILMITLIVIIHTPKEYQPYKPRARWRKILRQSTSKIWNRISSWSDELLNTWGDILYQPTNRRRKKYCFYQKQHRVLKCKRSSRVRLMRDMVWLCASNAVAAQPTVETTVQAHATTLNSLPKHTYFDTDSYELYVDNCASRCITNDLADFVDPPVPADVKIYGTNGISSGTLMGTVEWPIEDNTG